MNFYLAGAFVTRPTLMTIRAKIEKFGHKCTSSWLAPHARDAEIRDGNGDYIRSLALRYARGDLYDIDVCDMFILSDDGKPGTGGRNVELGYALARGKHIVRVGPPSNIFSDSMCDEEFDNWDDCIAYLACGFSF